MKNNKYTKIIPLSIGVIILSLIIGYVVWAWREPTGAPPTINVDAPINVGTTTQNKTGALGIGGVFQANNLAVFNNNVGIGTTTPAARLHVEGNIIAHAPTATSHVATMGWVQAQTGFRECYTINAAANVACDAGWTTLLSTSGRGCGITNQTLGSHILMHGLGSYRIRILDCASVTCFGGLTSCWSGECLDGRTLAGGSFVALEEIRCRENVWGVELSSTVALCCR